ncbi:MAG: 16S rRNA (adenine(1518)-N(6)/adenine(1519)-N(6))-dimethyltransferase RsmA [Flavobacteriales bacterium]|nr:16S rRNA (adenine(1518)-N(6)/adenine(1519)-N(6))-dimethyltransferase RsmA [Flavobacteriales bacterium]
MKNNNNTHKEKLVSAKKHLGQHFLTDLNISKKIAESLISNTKNILEIGPGMGVLTQFLLESKANVQVCEIDSESVEYLQNNFPQLNGKIIQGDFLKLELEKLFTEQVSIIGNFPYNISSQILFKALDYKELIPELVGMFQKEVAERVVAEHGNKTYGILSVLLQAYYDAEYLFTVHENVFNPPPKVKSAVIRLTRKENTDFINRKLLFSIVKTAFNQRRKKLSNALKSLTIPKSLESHNFLNLRAEQLSVNDFIELTKIWEDGKTKSD